MGEFASYYSLKNPQSFSGVVKFQKALKKNGKKVVGSSGCVYAF